MAAAALPFSSFSMVFVIVLALALRPAAAQEQAIPSGFELIFSGSQDQNTESLRFRTAYDSSATLGIFSFATLEECASLCESREGCTGLFFQVPTSTPNNNCRALTVADKEMPRSTVTRSYSLLKIPAEPVATEQPPSDDGGSSGDKKGTSILDLHWGWWIFFAVLPLIIFAIVMCCIKSRESDADDDKDESWDDDVEGGAYRSPLALAGPRDRQDSYFYETVAKNMMEEHLVSDTDTDTDYFVRGHGHADREFSVDAYMTRVATADRAAALEAPVRLARPSHHFYPYGDDTAFSGLSAQSESNMLDLDFDDTESHNSSFA